MTFRYLALLDDPSFLASASIHDASDIVLIENLTQAREVLSDLYTTGQVNHVATLRGGRLLFIAAPLSSDATLTLYHVADTSDTPRENWQKLIENGDPYPDYRLRIGRSGGIIQERL